MYNKKCALTCLLIILAVALFFSCGDDDGDDDDSNPNLHAKIVYERSSGSDSDIFIINTDGTGITQLTTTGNNYSPKWSPDGSKIFFVSMRDGDNEIFSINSDGTSETQLTINNDSDYDLDISPDGTKIAFVSDRDGDHEIYTIDINGGNPVNLTEDPDDDRDPVWSPDGTKIAFYSNRDGDFEIYVMNADGSIPTNLTNNTDNDRYPIWTADSTRIIYQSNEDGDGHNDVWIITFNATNKTRLTNDTLSESPTGVSGNGTKILFQRYDAICTMNLDGTAQAELISPDAFSSAWMPDQNMIVYIQDNELFIMNSDGSGPTNLSLTLEEESQPEGSYQVFE